jgi:hypothetical protein
MRRLIAIASITALTLGVGAAWALTPEVNTYSATSSEGHRVLFYIDTHTVHSFDLGVHQLFHNATLERHVADDGTVIPRFHFQSEHWRVKGHWVHSSEVHGSICNLVQSPSGCPDGQHLQTYVAQAKSPK